MAVAVAGILAAGCVVVPYSPPAESSSTPVRLEQADRVLVTVGPRQLLEDTSEALRRRDRDIEIVDSFAFRAAVFPEGDWRLSRLLVPERRSLLAASGADYLVVVGPVLTGAPDERGLFVGTAYGFYGAGTNTTQGSALMLIVDLARGEILDALRTRAEGTDVAVGFFYGLIIHATTESSVRRACLDSVVETLRRVHPEGRLRLVLMAAEPIGSSEYALSLITE
ncbi:MAG: hypothetical protein MUC71_14250 [Steroidobacteraceae bacterium]|jgi:hypothetical protein|nr:hypothetical protein [Steroidobacteraceae bacterium]